MKQFTFSLVIILALGLCASQIIKFPLEARSQEEEDQVLNHNGKLRNLAPTNYYVQKIKNYKKMQYYADIKLGSRNNQQVFSVFFDTYTSLSWIPNKSCVQNYACNGFNLTYTCRSNDTCTTTANSDNQMYLGGRVAGNYINASISVAGLDPIQSAILSANTVSNLQNLQSDGVIGLGMYNKYNYQANSYVQSLYNTGRILNPSFSIYLGFKQADSQITFGGFDTSTIKDLNTLYYHKVIINNAKDDSQKWQVPAKKVSIGTFNQDLTAGVAFSVSSQSYLGFSSDLFNQIIATLKTSNNIYKSGNAYQVKCDQKLPDLQITLPDSTNQDRVYTITPSFYVNNQTTSCEIMFYDNGNAVNNSVFLGTVFLRKYVSIYNYNNSTIGFAESVADPDDDYTKIPTWVIIVIAVGAVILIAVGGFFLFKKWKQRKNQRNLDYQQMNNNQINNNNYGQQDFTVNSAYINNSINQPQYPPQQNQYPPQPYQYPCNQNH